jgi:hypothetical protein
LELGIVRESGAAAEAGDPGGDDGDFGTEFHRVSICCRAGESGSYQFVALLPPTLGLFLFFLCGRRESAQ